MGVLESTERREPASKSLLLSMIGRPAERIPLADSDDGGINLMIAV